MTEKKKKTESKLSANDKTLMVQSFDSPTGTLYRLIGTST